MKWFKMMMVFAVTMVACSVASAQAPNPVPDPGPGQNPPNPCIALQQQINMCAAQCTAWDAVIQQKTASLAAARAGLKNWQDALAAFWEGVNQQGTPMTPGQVETLAAITSAINGANAFIQQTITQLQQAQQQFAQWQQALQQAQQAFQAAGC